MAIFFLPFYCYHYHDYRHHNHGPLSAFVDYTCIFHPQWTFLSLFTSFSWTASFVSSSPSICFVGCTFNPIPPHFPIVCFVSFCFVFVFLLRVHSTPFCLIFFTWQLKEADTRLHNKDNNLQTMLNELNTTISLKVNPQAFTYALQAINCGRGRRMIFYPTDDV